MPSPVQVSAILRKLLRLAAKGKIYLNPDHHFSAYFSSALQKKKAPVTITTDPKQADYAAQFQAEG